MDRRDFLKKTVTVAGGIAASRLLGETNVLAAGRSISNTDPIMDYATLNNGIRMPILGYGTLRIPVERCAECVSEAIRKGWRLIDTAKNYANETEVGKGIRQSGIDRSEVFITSKIAPDAMRSGKVRESLDRTIEAFGGNVCRSDADSLAGSRKGRGDMENHGGVCRCREDPRHRSK